KLDSIDAFDASTYRILLFQISGAIPCTTIAVPIKKIQSGMFILIRRGVSNINTKGIETIKPTIFEKMVLVSGSNLRESSRDSIVKIENVTIVSTIKNRPLP